MTQSPDPKAKCDCILSSGLMKSSCFDGACFCDCHKKPDTKAWEEEFDELYKDWIDEAGECLIKRDSSDGSMTESVKSFLAKVYQQGYEEGQSKSVKLDKESIEMYKNQAHQKALSTSKMDIYLQTQYAGGYMNGKKDEGVCNEIRLSDLKKKVLEAVNPVEWAERMVIKYANDTGRETNNRAYVREAGIKILTELLENLKKIFDDLCEK